MILPISFLKKIEYYTEDTYETYEDFRRGYCTCITLYFKSWFRPRKKLYFNWVCSDRDGDYATYTETTNLKELRNQLVAYFSKSQEDINKKLP